MLNKRQKDILSVLETQGKALPKKTMLELSAQVFRNSPIESYYSFFAYNNILYSFLFEHDIDILLKKNIIQVTGQNLKVANTTTALTALKQLNIDRHLAIGNILKSIDKESKKIPRNIKRKSSHKQERKTIFTVGYEGEDIDQFLIKIKQSGIELLIDIRKNPFSRKFGFSKSILTECLTKVGVAYIHMPELGIPSNLRKELSDYDSYQKLFDDYEANILTKTNESQAKIITMASEKNSALFCFEALPQFCHRHRLANELKKKYSVSVEHIKEYTHDAAH